MGWMGREKMQQLKWLFAQSYETRGKMIKLGHFIMSRWLFFSFSFLKWDSLVAAANKHAPGWELPIYSLSMETAYKLEACGPKSWPSIWYRIPSHCKSLSGSVERSPQVTIGQCNNTNAQQRSFFVSAQINADKHRRRRREIIKKTRRELSLPYQ